MTLGRALLRRPVQKGLTLKGYGRNAFTNGGASWSYNIASYGGLIAGGQPAAGDLVVMISIANFSSGLPNNVAPGGWATAPSSGYADAFTSAQAKVLSAGDLSSPPTLNDSTISGDGSAFAGSYWFAFSVTGTISAISFPTFNYQNSSASAPTNQSLDSSALNAPNVSISLALGGGNIASPSLSMGVTPDVSFENSPFSNAQVWDVMMRLAVGGEALTISKGDDGDGNVLTSTYLSVTFA